ncbi:MAG: hypothetical protein J7497_12755, partial [Chitinophagaceae bacterium]|nr:hypothetical protein [Chitinophagaceae bacterium]
QVFNKSAGIDFSVSNLTYDANGNIKTMLQKGLKVSSSATIDSLKYSYIGNSNKLFFVTDGVNDTSSKLGDFTELNDDLDQDYTYDGNGNLKTDMNKLLGFSRYNYLNLPDSIDVLSKGTISYTYDAIGRKLRKRVYDISNGLSAIVTITDYITDCVFINDTLQSIAHEEGRVSYTPAIGAAPAAFNYEYFIKDHLGNVRTMLTEQKKQEVYPAATLEGSLTTTTDAAYIEKQYYSINAGNVVDKSLATGITDYQNNNGNPPYNTNPNGNATANSQKLYKLLATGSGGVSGLGITLKVMAGDTINIFGKSYYFQNNTGGTNYAVPVLDILTGLLGAPTGAAAAKGLTASALNGVSAITSAVNTYLGDAGRGSGTVPKAYINWIQFDENFRFVSGNFSRVGTANTVKNHYTDAAMQNINIVKNGYIYVYVSNESPVSVFFDNLQVIHNRGPILQENHYYPFGLTMAGISAKAFGGVANKNLFGGKEFQTDEFVQGTDMDFYDFGARMYDPQIGRWYVIDPLADQMRRFSPYNYAFDNPLRFVDPDGRRPFDDYFSKTGKYLGSDGAATKNIRLISERVFNLIKTQNNGTVSQEATSDLQTNSKEITVQGNEAEVLNELWTKSNPNALDPAQKKEQGASLILDNENATLSLQVVDGTQNSQGSTTFPSTYESNGVEYADKTLTQVVIGRIHTHPNTKIDGANYSLDVRDASADIRNAEKHRWPSYAIDMFGVDKITPNPGGGSTKTNKYFDSEQAFKGKSSVLVDA